MENTKKRYELLDTLRGADLISMILYHASWDIIHFFGHPLPLSHQADHIWQQSICIFFILLSGFCSGLGKHTAKRGVTILGGAAVIFAVTFFFDRRNVIIFGVLTLIGCCMLIKAFTDRLVPKKEHGTAYYIIGAAVSLALFICTYNINDGTFLGMTVPEVLYRNYFTTWLGFKAPSFYTFDYFSMMPWGFMFMAGCFLFGLFDKSEKAKKLCTHGIKPLSFLGRHSLIIYLAHQPVVYGVLWLFLH